MTAVLVLASFAVFLLIDYLRSKKPTVQQAAVREREAADMPKLEPSYAAGFEILNNLRYHPGHTWTVGESPSFVRADVDDSDTSRLG